MSHEVSNRSSFDRSWTAVAFAFILISMPLNYIFLTSSYLILEVIVRVTGKYKYIMPYFDFYSEFSIFSNPNKIELIVNLFHKYGMWMWFFCGPLVLFMVRFASALRFLNIYVASSTIGGFVSLGWWALNSSDAYRYGIISGKGWLMCGCGALTALTCAWLVRKHLDVVPQQPEGDSQEAVRPLEVNAR